MHTENTFTWELYHVELKLISLFTSFLTGVLAFAVLTFLYGAHILIRRDTPLLKLEIMKEVKQFWIIWYLSNVRQWLAHVSCILAKDFNVNF